MKIKKRNAGIKVLSVDWDYFFPTKEVCGDAAGGEWVFYDWGHSETYGEAIMGTLWTTRASQFIQQGTPLPGVVVDPAFWSRFAFRDTARVYVADSHSRMQHFLDEKIIPVDEVWSFDAHHDAGYRMDALDSIIAGCGMPPVTCEDWAIHFKLAGAAIHVRYPKWRSYAMDAEPMPRVRIDRRVDDGAMVPVVFDAIFVCRSGAWVPPWCDDDFEKFVQSVPSVPGRNPRLVHRLQRCDKRPFDIEAAKKMAEATSQILDANRKDA